MARYIDADKLKAHYAWWGDTEERRTFDEIVDAQPTADVQEVRHACWMGSLCSHCGFDFWGDMLTEYSDFSLDFDGMNYCPMCGAIMGGGEDRQ